MELKITLEDIYRAWGGQDPDLADHILDLARASDPAPEKPPREGALSFRSYWNELKSYHFRTLSKEEQAAYRIEQIKLLEAPDAEVPLPDRFRLYLVLLELWRENGIYERDCLFRVIQTVPLKWGPWRAMKRIYKEAEQKRDTEMFGALAARFDVAFARGEYRYEVSRYTLTYLVRRAWRYLRQEAKNLPAAYADAAVDLLRFYQNDIPAGTWIFQRLLSGHNGNYLKNRAYPELWRRTPRPLFSLLERAQAETVKKYAVTALKTDFPVALREVEVDWIIRLIALRSQIIDEFLVWLLENTPRFAQDQFKTQNLHQPILTLLTSSSNEARKYAAAYARVYARDLETDRLIKLVNHNDLIVRELASDLLRERDPRNDVGLEAWGALLGTDYADSFAEDMLRNHFGAQELTPAWFKERLLEPDAFNFASEHLTRVHKYESLTPEYFYQLFDDPRLNEEVAEFLLKSLFHFPRLDENYLKRFLLHPYTRYTMTGLLEQDKVDLKLLGADFLKLLAYQPAYEKDPWIEEFIKKEKARGLDPDELYYDTYTGQRILSLLNDVRKFDPGELGFDWLLELVGSTDPHYHEFAMEYMIRAFHPAHFAGSKKIASPTEATIKGCEKIWEMLIAAGEEEDPMRLFAIRYIRSHHPDIGPVVTRRPLEAGAEVPHHFLNFERIKPLLTEKRFNLRRLGLDIARRGPADWEFSARDILALVESPFKDTRDFLAEALLAPDTKEYERYRIRPARLGVRDIYLFCESLHAFSRELGMRMILRNRELVNPEELFRLTESPDRKMRFFVIRTIWNLYRDRGVTLQWKPAPPQKSDEKKESAKSDTGTPPQPEGVPEKPRALPGENTPLRDFMRKMLFEIPPAKYTKNTDKLLKALPARKAKLYLIEVFRDIAVEDLGFARTITPLLQEFKHSKGKSEHAACLVALTRIQETHGEL